MYNTCCRADSLPPLVQAAESVFSLAPTVSKFHLAQMCNSYVRDQLRLCWRNYSCFNQLPPLVQASILATPTESEHACLHPLFCRIQAFLDEGGIQIGTPATAKEVGFWKTENYSTLSKFLSHILSIGAKHVTRLCLRVVLECAMACHARNGMAEYLILPFL